MLQKLLLTGLLLLGALSNAEAQVKTITQANQAAWDEGRSVPGAAIRIAHDSWTGEDKFVDHGFGSFAVAYISAALTHAESSEAEMRVGYWCAAFWAANEVKDAFLPWEKVGWVGGDGFSYKDLVWSLAGTGLALIVN